jgi:hypothetical protein
MSEPETVDNPTLYDEGGDSLVRADQASDRVTLLPQKIAKDGGESRIRIMWGQDMLRDLLDYRYRTVVCGVNAEDNSHGIISQLVDLTAASQWTTKAVTSHAKLFSQSMSANEGQSREPYVLKFDLDRVLLLGLLRPSGRDHFTPDDLARGFRTIRHMLEERADRRPVATVSFLGARSNRLIDPKTGSEPSFETTLRLMHESGFDGDVYPSPSMWRRGHVGVFPSYPFPAGLEAMRSGSS